MRCAPAVAVALASAQASPRSTRHFALAHAPRAAQEAWALLLPVQALLLQRVSANTLLPGGLRQEEMDVFVFLDAAICKAKGGGAVPAHVLSQKKGLFGGYSALVDTVVSTLNLLPLLPWPPAQAESARLFVLDALDVVPHTAGFQGMVAEEPDLVVYIEAMAGRPFDPAFRAAVLRKWMSPAVRNVLLARGVLQRSGALREREEAEFDARRNADIEQIGLRECAFFSCDKVEKTVREFKLCSGCRSVWYCSAEHHWLDWGAHKKRCGELTAAQK